ncbi:hypothetical protein [Lysobacter niastensis]|uniref:Uncharacterized protein n=1 Tax=Lysobacter niastensis TaxID=380629 RepID=A0ABS0B588_9GAMM|nr:hypothetical protein [Lysobacter niastensis]MBF6023968.1 hypothetical protein [Lysobacter niastensis]
MLNELWSWFQYNFWLSVACLVAGAIAISPFLASRSFRKRFFRSNYDIEHIGFIVLVVALLVIGLYDRFGAGSGA